VLEIGSNKRWAPKRKGGKRSVQKGLRPGGVKQPKNIRKLFFCQSREKTPPCVCGQEINRRIKKMVGGGGGGGGEIGWRTVRQVRVNARKMGNGLRLPGNQGYKILSCNSRKSVDPCNVMTKTVQRNEKSRRLVGGHPRG